MGHEIYLGSGRGPYVQQVCARGAVLQSIVVLVEWGYKRRGRGGEAESLRSD
jgi:hypothetical protein